MNNYTTLDEDAAIRKASPEVQRIIDRLDGEMREDKTRLIELEDSVRRLNGTVKKLRAELTLSRDREQAWRESNAYLRENQITEPRPQ